MIGEHKVHPVAALFPMMTDDELDDLATDIKANGLVHPIVLDAEGMLIDGRNRLEGCERAGVKPTFTTLNGQDPIAFILSCNVTRRHLSKGQQAMAVARARLLSNRSMQKAAETTGVSKARVVQASIVLDYAPDLADAVLAGTTPLNDAYEEARRRKSAADGREAQLVKLQTQAPDLVALVQEERLTLAGALAEVEERKRRERERVQSVTHHLNTWMTRLDPGGMDREQYVREWLDADPAMVGITADFSAERARRAREILDLYIKMKEAKERGQENA